MKYHLLKSNGYSLATIEQKKSKTVLAYISTDLHTQQTAHHRATELLYCEALLSGAGKYNRAQFLDALNLLGATVKVSIADGVFTLFIRSSADAYKKVLALAETLLTQPQFSKSELTRIKLTTVNAIKESKEDSKAIALEELRNSFYALHDRRYSYDDDTIIKAVAAITPKHLQKLHTELLKSAWTCTQASGPLEIKQFEALVKKTNNAKKTDEPLRIHQQKPPHPGLTLRNIPSRQNIDFSIGAPLPITMHHPGYAPLIFGITVLGKWGGFTGRLMSTVREQEGLTYGIYAGTEGFYIDEQGYWRIMTFFSPKQALQGLTSTLREVAKLYKEGITKEELVKFKKIIKTGQALKNDSTANLLSELHAYHSQQFTLAEMEEYKNRILAVTLKEVNEAIKLYLNPNTLTISGAGPVEKVRKELLAFSKSVS
jgi:zinc protease